MEPEPEIAQTIRVAVRELDIERVKAAIAEAKDSDIDIQSTLLNISATLTYRMTDTIESKENYQKMLKILEIVYNSGYTLGYDQVSLARAILNNKMELVELIVKKNPHIDLNVPYFRDKTIAKIVCNSQLVSQIIWGIVHGLCPITHLDMLHPSQMIYIMKEQMLPYLNFLDYPSFIKNLITKMGLESTINLLVDVYGEDKKEEVQEKVIGILAINRRKHLLSHRFKGGRRTRRKRKSRRKL